MEIAIDCLVLVVGGILIFAFLQLKGYRLIKTLALLSICGEMFERVFFLWVRLAKFFPELLIEKKYMKMLFSINALQSLVTGILVVPMCFLLYRAVRRILQNKTCSSGETLIDDEMNVSERVCCHADSLDAGKEEK